MTAANDLNNKNDVWSHDDSKPRLGIIEGNVDWLDALMSFLRAHGYDVWGCESAERFWRQLYLSPVDIVLIDAGVLGCDGLSLASYMKQLHRHGLIMMAAGEREPSRLKILSSGAGVHPAKPIHFSELEQQLRVLWQRMLILPSEDTVSRSWHLDISAHCLCDPQGQTLKLTSQELALLRFLLAEPGAVCDKGALHHAMFTHSSTFDRHRVDVVLSRLRKKAREQQFHLPIRSVFGQGLAFVHDVE